jgi:hypothetical protein
MENDSFRSDFDYARKNLREVGLDRDTRKVYLRRMQNFSSGGFRQKVFEGMTDVIPPALSFGVSLPLLAVGASLGSVAMKMTNDDNYLSYLGVGLVGIPLSAGLAYLVVKIDDNLKDKFFHIVDNGPLSVINRTAEANRYLAHPDEAEKPKHLNETLEKCGLDMFYGS